MKFRKNEEVIVQIETYAKVIKATKDTVQVSIGKMNYSLDPEKVKKVVPEKEKPEAIASKFSKVNEAKYIKHLESELMAKEQTIKAYRQKLEQVHYGQ